jgi:GT2 family glycosyltransferase
MSQPDRGLERDPRASRSRDDDRDAAESARVGVVAIGRNEGERLRRCLASLAGRRVVYVDSGSTDGSRELARSFGADVVELDLSRPFTAARARNAGFERLTRVHPDVELVQFVDGDCMLDPDWIDVGARTLRAERDAAVVCGRRREIAPERSVYDRLCDIEWDTPVGEARACGGDALMRADAFRRVGGFDPNMIAGEEPDLCLRLLRSGYRIVRADAEMTRHEAAMTRWTQWWKRALRTGHTTAELLAKYGNAPEHRRLRRASSALFWAVALPLIAVAAFAWSLAALGPLAAALVCAATIAAYALLLARVARRCARSGRSAADARAYAISCALAKWPETWGMLMYTARRALGQRALWIEYKDGPRGLASASGSAVRSAATAAESTRRG